MGKELNRRFDYRIRLLINNEQAFSRAWRASTASSASGPEAAAALHGKDEQPTSRGLFFWSAHGPQGRPTPLVARRAHPIVPGSRMPEW